MDTLVHTWIPLNVTTLLKNVDVIVDRTSIISILLLEDFLVQPRWSILFFNI